MDNFKHKLYTACNLCKEALLPSSIVYYVLLRKDYIQMSFSPRIPKWESQNWDSYGLKYLGAYIFLK
jgi:hypothetical protein